jgi:phosphoglycolate phosphatase
VTTSLHTLAPVLLCDLDGTLVDSAPDLASALSDLLAEAGRRRVTEAEVKTMVGDGVAVLVERGFAATGGVPAADELAARIARYVAIYETRLTARTRPFPGAVEALQALRAAGWRLAVCTNKPEHASREIVSALGMDALFDAVAGGDTFPVKKPDPGHVLRLLEAMDAAPDHAVMLGDSRNDVLSAHAAGLPVIAVAHGYGTVPADALGADRLIEAFDELPAALTAVARHLFRDS